MLLLNNELLRNHISMFYIVRTVECYPDIMQYCNNAILSCDDKVHRNFVTPPICRFQFHYPSFNLFYILYCLADTIEISFVIVSFQWFLLFLLFILHPPVSHSLPFCIYLHFSLCSSLSVFVLINRLLWVC